MAASMRSLSLIRWPARSRSAQCRNDLTVAQDLLTLGNDFSAEQRRHSSLMHVEEVIGSFYTRGVESCRSETPRFSAKPIDDKPFGMLLDLRPRSRKSVDVKRGLYQTRRSKRSSQCYGGLFRVAVGRL